MSGTKKSKKTPEAAVFLLVVRHGRLVVGRRKSGAARGTWGTPGGKLDFGESFEECAARELREETGLDLRASSFVAARSDHMPRSRAHLVTIWLRVTDFAGELRNAAPAETEGWEWRGPADLPEPAFPPLAALRDSPAWPADLRGD